MSALRYSLFFLPIHHYTYERYYERYKGFKKKEKKQLEEECSKPFEKFSESTKRMWENIWQWPPWKFNDILGYLDIGTDGGGCLTANIFLKRKYIPKGYPNKRIGNPKKTNEILYFQETHRFPVKGIDNNAYLQAFNRLLETTKKIIKKRNRTFELWLPPFDFSCFNFVEAVRQAET